MTATVEVAYARALYRRARGLPLLSLWGPGGSGEMIAGTATRIGTIRFPTGSDLVSLQFFGAYVVEALIYEFLH